MTGKFDIHFLWERCACGADTITSLLGCTLGAQEVPGPHELTCVLCGVEVKEQQTEANENARNDYHQRTRPRPSLCCDFEGKRRGTNSTWPEK